MSVGSCGGVEELLYYRDAILFGEFRLTSGGTSGVYVDLRRVLGDRESFTAIASLLAWEVRGVIGGSSYVVGVATAGIPWASFISMVYGKPLGYVRLERKPHGTSSRVEGGIGGGTCILIDDVATTGSSMVEAIRALRNHKCRVSHAAVIVDREQGAREALAREGVNLISVTTLGSILRCLVRQGLLKGEERDIALRELSKLEAFTP